MQSTPTSARSQRRFSTDLHGIVIAQGQVHPPVMIISYMLQGTARGSIEKGEVRFANCYQRVNNIVRILSLQGFESPTNLQSRLQEAREQEEAARMRRPTESHSYRFQSLASMGGTRINVLDCAWMMIYQHNYGDSSYSHATTT